MLPPLRKVFATSLNAFQLTMGAADASEPATQLVPSAWRTVHSMRLAMLREEFAEQSQVCFTPNGSVDIHDLPPTTLLVSHPGGGDERFGYRDVRDCHEQRLLPLILPDLCGCHGHVLRAH